MKPKPHGEQGPQQPRWFHKHRLRKLRRMFKILIHVGQSDDVDSCYHNRYRGYD